MRRRHLVVAALLGASLVACGDDAPTWDRAACTPALPQDAGTTEIVVPSGGRERRALLHVPEGYDGTEQQPVVLSWHGFGSAPESHVEYADFRPLADDDDFLVVVPRGEGEPPRFNQEQGITGDTDDVRFALDLLDAVAAQVCVDPARVYSVGQSNGGGMSAVLACRAPDRFAAIAMSALLLLPDDCGTPAPAVLGIMGTHDLVVPYPGGTVACCGGWEIAPADRTMEAWAAHAGCAARPDEGREADHVERRVWSDCTGDVEVRYLVVEGGGHTWPGASPAPSLGPTNDEIDATEEVWHFFRRFARPQ